MAGRREIAKLAGVSTTTVTRVLSKCGSVSEKTARRVEAAVQEIGYTRNAIASNLSKKRQSNVIALLVPDMTNYYYMQMFDAMVRCSRRYGATISIYSILNNNVDEVVDEVVANRASGIVNMGLVPVTHECLKRVKCMGIRMLYTGIRNQEEFVFKINHEKAMRDAVRHLKQTGCERIGFLFGMRGKLLHDAKIHCFRESLLAEGYEWDESNVILGLYPHYSAISIGYQKAKELFTGRKPFDALFCLTDMMAIGATRAILECGLRIPEDVSVIGFDGILLDEYSTPSISTIKSDIVLEAQSYVECCMGLMDRDSVEVKSKFIPRSSVRRLDTEE